MLKIKDSIDLNKLEEFGFRRVDLVASLTGELLSCWVSDARINYIIVGDYVNCFNAERSEKALDTAARTLGCADWSKNNNLDLLYDLIQSGLVEKRESPFSIIP